MEEQVAARLATIETDVAWIKKRLQEGDVALDQVDKALGGNGKLGLSAKVNILWYGQVWLVGLLGTAFGACLHKWLG